MYNLVVGALLVGFLTFCAGVTGLAMMWIKYVKEDG